MNFAWKAIPNQIVTIIDDMVVILEHNIPDGITDTLEDATSVSEGKSQTGIKEKVIPLKAHLIVIPRVHFDMSKGPTDIYLVETTSSA